MNVRGGRTQGGERPDISQSGEVCVWDIMQQIQQGTASVWLCFDAGGAELLRERPITAYRGLPGPAKRFTFQPLSLPHYQSPLV